MPGRLEQPPCPGAFGPLTCDKGCRQRPWHPPKPAWLSAVPSCEQGLLFMLLFHVVHRSTGQPLSSLPGPLAAPVSTMTPKIARPGSQSPSMQGAVVMHDGLQMHNAQMHSAWHAEAAHPGSLPLRLCNRLLQQPGCSRQLSQHVRGQHADKAPGGLVNAHLKALSSTTTSLYGHPDACSLWTSATTT